MSQAARDGKTVDAYFQRKEPSTEAARDASVVQGSAPKRGIPESESTLAQKDEITPASPLAAKASKNKPVVKKGAKKIAATAEKEQGAAAKAKEAAPPVSAAPIQERQEPGDSSDKDKKSIFADEGSPAPPPAGQEPKDSMEKCSSPPTTGPAASSRSKESRVRKGALAPVRKKLLRRAPLKTGSRGDKEKKKSGAKSAADKGKNNPPPAAGAQSGSANHASPALPVQATQDSLAAPRPSAKGLMETFASAVRAKPTDKKMQTRGSTAAAALPSEPEATVPRARLSSRLAKQDRKSVTVPPIRHQPAPNKIRSADARRPTPGPDGPSTGSKSRDAESVFKRPRAKILDFSDEEEDDDDCPSQSAPPTTSKRTAVAVVKKRRKASTPVQDEEDVSLPRPVKRAKKSARHVDNEPASSPAPVPRRVEVANAHDRRLKGVIKDKRIAQAFLESERKRADALEKQLAEERITIQGLKATVAALQASLESTQTDPQLFSQTGSRKSVAGSDVRKKQSLAGKKGKQASDKARLPTIQSHLLDLVEENALAFCKAVVRQYAPDDFLLGGEARVHAWNPAPRALVSKQAAKEAGSKTSGRGLLGEGDGGGSLVVEPPMLCTSRPAMAGGLFGVYPGKFSDWVLPLARIMASTRDTWGGVRDEAGRLATNYSDDEMERHCLAATASAGAAAARSKIHGTVSYQASHWKRSTSEYFLKSLGYNPDPTSVAHAKLVVHRVYGYVIPKDEPDMEGPDIVSLAESWMNPDRIRCWRMRSYSELASPDLDQAALADMDPHDGVDELFRNAAARATYHRWAVLKRSTKRRAGTQVISGDASILTLARLDAWMATRIFMDLRVSKRDDKGVSTKGGDADAEKVVSVGLLGSVRNGFHNYIFEKLLPRAVEGVLSQCRSAVRRTRPQELRMPFDDQMAVQFKSQENAEELIDAHNTSQTPCRGPEGHKGDLHSQRWRKVTSSHISPFDGRFYVVACPSFIRNSVCDWIGDVRDAFVGVCDTGNKYAAITASESEEVSMRNNKRDGKDPSPRAAKAKVAAAQNTDVEHDSTKEEEEEEGEEGEDGEEGKEGEEKEEGQVGEEGEEGGEGEEEEEEECEDVNEEEGEEEDEKDKDAVVDDGEQDFEDEDSSEHDEEEESGSDAYETDGSD